MSSRAERMLNLALQQLQQNKRAVSSCEDMKDLDTDDGDNEIAENRVYQNIQALDNLDINTLPIEIVENGNIIELNEGTELEIIEWDNPIPNETEESYSNLNDINNNINIHPPYQDVEREVNSHSSKGNNDSDTDYVPNTGNESESDQDDQEESYNNQNNENLDVQENNVNADCGDMNEGRKRSKIVDENKWKRMKSQRSRMKGEPYLGFSRDKNKTFKHNVPRAARQIGERCSSKMCLTSKKRFCNSITEEARNQIFTKFWKNMTWDQRKVYVSGHVSLQNTVRKTTENESRRANTLIYKLNNGKEMVQVCRDMFLRTIGLGRFTVESWVKDSAYGMNDSKCELNEKRKIRNYRFNCFEKYKHFLNKFFDDLPKQPSHYVRKDTNKLYLEQHFVTLKQLHGVYKEVCDENQTECLGIKTFKEIFKEKNLSLFTPKKDRCDLCIGYETKNIDESQWKDHIDKKDSARKEQSNDKARALQNECIMICMDLQAVKVAPSMNATKMYFKTKLGCHNFTIYNCASHQATCYWFTELDCGLSASTFVSCLIDYLERHCLGKHLPIIIYSDGCTFQNRNNVMANALLNFANLHCIAITQKYLTKGHTQMECDSVHSCIERKLKNRVIELPSDYVKASKEARSQPEPYEVIQLNHDFFKDFTNPEWQRYSAIRPNRNAHVTDIKAIYYDPKGHIKIQIDFNDEFQDHPVRCKNVAPVLNYPKLYNHPLPITKKKWNHLQDLKSVISKDCHLFYDLIPHSQEPNLEKEKERDMIEPPVKKSKQKKIIFSLSCDFFFEII